MEKQEKHVLESYLITGSDYADFQVAVRRMKTGRRELLLFRIAGMALILASLLGRVYFGGRSQKKYRFRNGNIKFKIK